jgi:hypothetical protein
VAVVIGVLFLLPGLLTICLGKQLFRPRTLVIEPRGVCWDDPRGKPWAVAWPELAAVSISKHTAVEVKVPTLSERIAQATAEKMVGESALVRLDLFPADAGFATRHPEMAHLWGRQEIAGYRLPLGRNVKFIPLIEQAMVRFAPHIYRGVQATEGFMGLT